MRIHVEWESVRDLDNCFVAAYGSYSFMAVKRGEKWTVVCMNRETHKHIYKRSTSSRSPMKIMKEAESQLYIYLES